MKRSKKKTGEPSMRLADAHRMAKIRDDLEDLEATMRYADSDINSDTVCDALEAAAKSLDDAANAVKIRFI